MQNLSLSNMDDSDGIIIGQNLNIILGTVTLTANILTLVLILLYERTRENYIVK